MFTSVALWQTQNNRAPTRGPNGFWNVRACGGGGLGRCFGVFGLDGFVVVFVQALFPVA